MENDNTIAMTGAVRTAISGYLQRELKASGIVDFAPAHAYIVSALLEHSVLSMKELATHTRRDKSTVTAHVTKLEKLGYVRRVPDSRDGRGVKVMLTDKGIALEEPLVAIEKSLVRNAFKGVTAEGKLALQLTLRKMCENLSEPQ